MDPARPEQLAKVNDDPRYHRPMRRDIVALNLVNNILPLAGVLLAIYFLWGKYVDAADIIVMLGLHFLIGGIGVSTGFHRYFSHRSYKTSKPVEYTLSVLGCLGGQGDAIRWAADHRKHHTFSDEPGDPHSPHHPTSPGGMLYGLYWAHFGWLFHQHGVAGRKRYASDLWSDPFLRFCYWFAPGFYLISFAIPFVMGWLLYHNLGEALEMMIWGGPVRMFLNQHSAWLINSIGHSWGSRRFDIDDQSRNVAWLAPVTFGDGWHHNHHAFPTSAYHGFTRLEKIVDLSGHVIWLGEKLGLMWDVTRISPERMAKKELEPEQ